MSETGTPLLTFNNLGKLYGYHYAVNKSGGALYDGDYISLFGANGAGKSTLLYLLSGVYRPDAGGVDYLPQEKTGDEELKTRKKRFLSISHLLSHHSMLYNRMSVAQNLAFYGSLYKNRKLKPDSDEIKQVLNITSMGYAANKTADSLSRGMLQRLTIARMLLSKPEVVFFDEPFTGLDIQGQKLLGEIIEKRGLPEMDWKIRAFIFVDHGIEKAYEYCNKVWFIEKGKLHTPQLRPEISLESIREMLS